MRVIALCRCNAPMVNIARYNRQCDFPTFIHKSTEWDAPKQKSHTPARVRPLGFISRVDIKTDSKQAEMIPAGGKRDKYGPANPVLASQIGCPCFAFLTRF